VDGWSFEKPLKMIDTVISMLPESYTLGQASAPEHCTVHLKKAVIKYPGCTTLASGSSDRHMDILTKADMSVLEELALEATNFKPGASRQQVVTTVDERNEIVRSRLMAWWKSLCATETCAGSELPRKTNAPVPEYSQPEAGVTVHTKGTFNQKIDTFVYREKISEKEWLELHVSRQKPPSILEMS
jgi:hypothetical protein